MALMRVGTQPTTHKCPQTTHLSIAEGEIPVSPIQGSDAILHGTHFLPFGRIVGIQRWLVRVFLWGGKD